jgi:hypothetical protein
MTASFCIASDWRLRCTRLASCAGFPRWRDLSALLALVRLFRAERFTIVHSVSPKAGLLAMLSARIAGVPHRVHTFTGQVWVTRCGWRRRLLKLADRGLAALTTRALVDSPSQRDFLLAERVLAADKSAGHR